MKMCRYIPVAVVVGSALFIGALFRRADSEVALTVLRVESWRAPDDFFLRHAITNGLSTNATACKITLGLTNHSDRVVNYYPGFHYLGIFEHGLNAGHWKAVPNIWRDPYYPGARSLPTLKPGEGIQFSRNIQAAEPVRVVVSCSSPNMDNLIVKFAPNWVWRKFPMFMMSLMNREFAVRSEGIVLHEILVDVCREHQKKVTDAKSGARKDGDRSLPLSKYLNGVLQVWPDAFGKRRTRSAFARSIGAVPHAGRYQHRERLRRRVAQ